MKGDIGKLHTQMKMTTALMAAQSGVSPDKAGKLPRRKRPAWSEELLVAAANNLGILRDDTQQESANASP